MAFAVLEVTASLVDLRIGLNNTYKSFFSSVLINSGGKQQELGCFTFDDNSEALYSCSLTWNNHMYIFGGVSNRRQISKLVGNNLQVIGNLTFYFDIGGCTNMADRKLFLCFDLYDAKRCRWSTGPLSSFHNASLSSYSHYRTRISSSECKCSIFVEVLKNS